MNQVQSSTRQLLARAFLPAPLAFALGYCLVRSLVKHDGLSFGGLVFTSACLTFALFCTRRSIDALAAGKLPTNESARSGARQYLFSCAIYSLNAASFGAVVSGAICGTLPNSLGIAIVIFWGAIVCIGIYPVHRDAKRCVAALSSY